MANELSDLWDAAKTKGMSEEALLLYRSNLLGSDLRVTNFGGGNTSAKVTMKDPLTGKPVEVLWVKGSGGDIGSMKLDGFSTLYLEKLESLKDLYRGLEHEDEMVGYLPHCTFNLNPRAASIDTPLHAFVPHPHVDHVHPDAVIAIAASENGASLTNEIYGGKVGWLEWQRPGFDLGLKLGALCNAHPEYEGVVLGKHGLFAWGETAEDCYRTTVRLIRKAQAAIDAKTSGTGFAESGVKELSDPARRAWASRLMPVLRGRLSKLNRKVGHFTDVPEILSFVGSKDLKRLAALGTSCPDHFLRTKIRPMVLDLNPAKTSAEEAIGKLDALVETYRAEYEAYYKRWAVATSPAIRDPYPVIVLVPGIGLFSFAQDKTTARQAAEFYVNAINVMRGAQAISRYTGLPEEEAFQIEYWLLEEAKLQRMPKPKALAAKIALITGGGGGIGKATAKRLLDDGAAVVLSDIDAKALEAAQAELGAQFGADKVRSVVCNVTDEASVVASFQNCALQYGGVDILVSNAGIASSSPYEDTSLVLWQKNIDILATGYFLVSREGYKMMLDQRLDGSVIFVASKNGLAASAGAAAYCTAKAAEVHLARCLALEGAPHGIRVNIVNPDAVIRGSKIWDGDWKKERASANKIELDDVEAHYRQRSLLKRSVYPEDVAEAVAFFASDVSAKSTGNVLNVDAGNLVSFPR